MNDSYKLRGLRQALVKEVRRKGIREEAVLEAIGNIPRHIFVESAFAEVAYEDRALPIDAEQTISQPYTVAYQTAQLALKPGHKVLEIGTGSGYQTAVLCYLGAKVFSIERIRSLHESAKKQLTLLGYRPRLKWGDGTVGWAAFAPFDAIIVTAGAPAVPEVLKAQLAIGGQLIIPVGNKNIQKMLLIKRKAEKEFESTKMSDFQFVPMIGAHGWKE